MVVSITGYHPGIRMLKKVVTRKTNMKCNEKDLDDIHIWIKVQQTSQSLQCEPEMGSHLLVLEILSNCKGLWEIMCL